MGTSTSKTATGSNTVKLMGKPESPDEETPLLPDEDRPQTIGFRRVFAASKAKSQREFEHDHQSVRGASTLFLNEQAQAIAEELGQDIERLEPAEALAPLVAGGVIINTSGYKTLRRPPCMVKSLPACAPFRRKARHRSFRLYWLNEFRHWWKSSRLLVRLAGLFTLAATALFIEMMVRITPFVPLVKKHKRAKAYAKNTHRAIRVVKQLGRGGPMYWFLQSVKVFTRTLRIIVGGWRWVEASQARRGEVGTEEFMAFVGNRVSRMLSRTFVDMLVAFLVMPSSYFLFGMFDLPENAWHPITLFIVLGVLRAVAPYAASFQGSRAGRVLTRSFFQASKHRWQPIQTVECLNLQSDDCNERDEVSQSADLVKIGHLVAKALGKTQQIGIDGTEGQDEALTAEGFRQVGAGSGGYAVYECRRRVWSREKEASMVILLHITPYGPSILDVMPRYIVLEFEDSVDRRNKWSEFVFKQLFEGPPVVEGYCYNGAFFSPYHFAELKEMYDKQLLAYDSACKTMVKPRTGRNPNPPSDLASLKAFLADGKRARTRKKNAREYRQLQRRVSNVARELRAMMPKKKGGHCFAPKGVLLYFEGLDCAGKSSTGGLVEQVLRQAGYQVDMRQYNRPPTEEQKRRPWMARFEVPKTSSVAIALKGGVVDDKTKTLMNKCVEHSHSALVWDRGPAGDFVYNSTFRQMGHEQRRQLYNEYMAFDKDCFDNEILFLKLLFVTNRDSIAATLGKRLAHKKMAKDLNTWLKSSRGGSVGDGEVGFEGLDEIELHIDPTDFVAFNCYQKNLRRFTNFAINTDSPDNPWIVVNTGDRYVARKNLLRAFRLKLERFKERQQFLCCQSSYAEKTHQESPAIDEAEMLNRGFNKPIPVQLLMTIVCILLLLFYYSEHPKFGTNIRKGADTLFSRGDSVLDSYDGNITAVDLLSLIPLFLL